MNEQRTENQSLDCAVAQDLLPLYNDGVVSAATGQALQRHLEHCKACRREYEELREILPVRAEDFTTTKERFLAMERQLERRRIFRVIWIVVLIVALAAGVGYLLTGVHLLPVNKQVEEILQTYRYEDARGTHFLILYRGESEWHGGSSSGTTILRQEGDTAVLQEEWKTNLLGKKFTDTSGRYRDVCLEESGIPDGSDIHKLLYQGKVAWTEEENGDDPIPAYVPLYFALREGDYTGSPEADGSMSIEVDKGYVQAVFKDGKLILWDLDGTLLYEGYPNGSAPEATPEQ